MTREVQEAVQRTERALASNEGTAALARDNQLGAVLNNPQQRREYEDQLRERGLLGSLTIDFVGRNSGAIDGAGNGNGNIDRTELQRYIDRQTASRAEGSPLAVFAARQALRTMEQGRTPELTQAELRNPTARMQPEAASMRQAIDQYPGIRDVMRSMDPSNVEGNTVHVGALRQALRDNPNRFTEAQRQAAATLLDERNIGSIVSNNSDYGGRTVLNNLWRGNDGRFLNPDLMERRATALGGERTAGEEQARQAREDLLRRFNEVRGEATPPGANPRETGPRRPGEPRNYEPSADTRFNEYTVRSGDTMWHIAKEFMQRNNPNGETPTDGQVDRFYRAIARENNIADPNNVPRGTRLRIPREYQPIITNPARQRN